MNYDKVRELLTTAFMSAWGAPGDFPVTMEGQKFDRPKTTWGRWSVTFGQANQQSIGNSFTRVQGIAYLQVFIPEEGGTKAALDAATKLGLAMDRLVLRAAPTFVHCQIVGVMNAGVSEGRTQKNIWLPFYADHNPAG